MCLVTQSCLTLCDPMDCIQPGLSGHGILQARILDWVALSFSKGCSQPGTEPRSPTSQADSLLTEPPGEPFKGDMFVCKECRIYVFRKINDEE